MESDENPFSIKLFDQFLWFGLHLYTVEYFWLSNLIRKHKPF